MKKIFGIALMTSLFFSTAAHAGTSSGRVTVIYAHAGDVVIFSAGPHLNKPGCSVAADEWAFSLSTPTGKAMYALLLSAQVQGKPLNVVGSQACTAWSDREAPTFIQLIP